MVYEQSNRWIALISWLRVHRQFWMNGDMEISTPDFGQERSFENRGTSVCPLLFTAPCLSPIV